MVEGVHQLKLPVPFPLKFIASYLVEGRDGWAVIDPGFDYPPAREVWESEAARMGLDLDRDVTRIIVTHLHPDHIGLARWLEGRSRAPVFMLKDEIANARHVWDPARGSEDFREVHDALRHGPRNGGRDGGNHQARHTLARKFGAPSTRRPDRAWGERRAGDSHTRSLGLSLHSARQSRRLLFVGDHLLLEITPNIDLWTYTAPRPLQRYLDSIDGLGGLDVDLIFPGHGPLFHDLDGRIDELVRHHEERLSVMHGALAGEPATEFEIARRVFPDELSDHQLRFAVAETLAHLEDDGRAERLGGDVVRYRAA